MNDRQTKVIEAIRRFGRPEPCTMCGTVTAWEGFPPLCHRHAARWARLVEAMADHGLLSPDLTALEKAKDKP